MITKKLFEKVI